MNGSFNRLLADHSLHYIEMALRTDRIERVENPNGYGKRTGDCGDTIEFFLMTKGGLLDQVSFSTEGCMNTIACCNTVADLIEGKSIDQAWEVSPEQIVHYLETLPEDHHHCAELAAGTLYLALKDINR